MSLPNDLAHLKIPFENILSATNNFDDKNVVAKGGYEKIYIGELLWSGELIKIFSRRFNKDRDEMFLTEVLMLSSLKHQNLVSLVGFCDENGEKIIITRCEIKGGLGNYLSDTKLLTWVRRLEISVSLAQALAYVHYDESRDFSVIHRNITSDTVLLNDDWEPKLSDFERSMSIKASERHHSFNNGACPYTNGYVDSTFMEAKTVNHKSDMYSFGIVLFELLCGRKSIIANDTNKYLAPLAITHYREKKLNEIIDWDLLSQIDLQSFNIFAEIAYACLNEERSERPNIDEIVTRLKEALELQRKHHSTIMSSRIPDLAHLKIPLESILSATNNFDAKNVVAIGGYDKLYIGELRWSGELIIITARRFNNDEDEMFWTEVSMLSSLKHQNLVSLVGFCDENGEKIIITRREMKTSLVNYLSDATLLTWVQRLEISVGLAHALSYIHYDEQRNFSVIHRHISSFTVLLNDKCEPKLSCFENSMKIEATQRHHSFHANYKLWNRNGYTDPTYEKTKSVNHKMDIYSFGIVLFELLCGRESIIAKDTNKYLAPAAILHYKEKKLGEIIDWDLWKQMNPQSFNVFTETAYKCLNEEQSQRPSINEIVARLEKALELQLTRENTEHSVVEGSSSCIDGQFQDLKIELEAIKSATNGFASSHYIGKGGFGKVYKGELLHSKGRSVVALKRLDRAFGQGNPEFWKEIIMLSLYKHDNIVSLLGFCDDCGEKILAYEYASKKSLDLYLNDKDLRWVQRLEICIGAARGLAYLHDPGQTQQRVLHRDIKSSNILLDENWNARIADLGLSKFGPANQKYTFVVSNAVGTIGYCDPSYVETGLLTKESDVYSFGVVLFEMLCGRLCIGNNLDERQPLTELVRKCYEENTIDEIVYGNIKDEINPHSLKAFTAIAYQCLKRGRKQRPLMTEVVKVLESALQLQVSNVPPPPSLSISGRASTLQQSSPSES